MEGFKLPIAVMVTLVLQIGGAVWWVSQQASTISDLEATVEELADRGAIEDAVNLKRDVLRHTEEVDALWEAVDSNGMYMDSIIDLKRRISVLETEMKYMSRAAGHPSE